MDRKALSRRDFLRGAVGVAGGAVLASCAPAVQTVEVEKEVEVTREVQVEVEKEVQVTVQVPIGERKPVTCLFWDAVVPGYREEPMRRWDDTQQEYYFDYQWSPDYYNKLTIMMAGGQPPDLFIIETSWLPDFLNKGALYDIQPFIDADNYDLSDFPQIAMDAYAWRGGFYGLPDNITGWCIYYNKDLFDEAGAMYPTNQWDDPAWTTDDFMESCRKLKDIGAFGFALSSHWLVLGIFMTLFGGFYVDDSTNPTKATVDSPEAIDAMQWLADLRWEYDYAPQPAAIAEMGTAELVQTGRLGMAIGGGWGVKSWEDYDFAWDIGHFPAGPAGRNNYTFYYPLCIAAESDVPEGAWSLLKFYEDEAIKDIIKLGNLQGTKIADMRALFETDPVPESREVLVDSVQHFGFLDPQLTNWNEMVNAVLAELDYLWTGEKDAAEACAAANAVAEDLLPAGQI